MTQLEINELEEDVGVILCLSVCSDGIRKEEEERVINSSFLSENIKSNYRKFIKLIELLQKDSDTISLGFFTKIIEYSEKLNSYEHKDKLFNLVVDIVYADRVRTHSEEQFLDVLRTKWNLKNDKQR